MKTLCSPSLHFIFRIIPLERGADGDIIILSAVWGDGSEAHRSVYWSRLLCPHRPPCLIHLLARGWHLFLLSGDRAWSMPGEASIACLCKTTAVHLGVKSCWEHFVCRNIYSRKDLWAFRAEAGKTGCSVTNWKVEKQEVGGNKDCDLHHVLAGCTICFQGCAEDTWGLLTIKGSRERCLAALALASFVFAKHFLRGWQPCNRLPSLPSLCGRSLSQESVQFYLQEPHKCAIHSPKPLFENTPHIYR